MSGTLTLSVEIELGWGVHDLGTDDHLSEGCQRERQYMTRLLDACDEFDVPVSFDVVGHLFFDTCDSHDTAGYPEGWFDADPETGASEDPAFYAPDLIGAVAVRPTTRSVRIRSRTSSAGGSTRLSWTANSGGAGRSTPSDWARRPSRSSRHDTLRRPPASCARTGSRSFASRSIRAGRRRPTATANCSAAGPRPTSRDWSTAWSRRTVRTTRRWPHRRSRPVVATPTGRSGGSRFGSAVASTSVGSPARPARQWPATSATCRSGRWPA